MLMGLVNCIDCLIVVKDLIFDKKLFSIPTLLDAVHNNWNGYENLRTLILKKTDFFGNDGDTSNGIASLFYSSLYGSMKDKKNIFGHQWLVGDLAGYNEHYKWFGDDTKATPDGRYNGEMMKFGLGQNEGRDRKGLTALLNSVAKADKDLIGCGSTVTNISLDKAVVDDDEQFEKLVDTFESYFKNGGVHFQLTYVSKDDLLKAQLSPSKYPHLRVRVSGYSDYFINLRESIQNDIIRRTDK
jgi:formate C-acetyltransferase